MGNEIIFLMTGMGLGAGLTALTISLGMKFGRKEVDEALKQSADKIRATMAYQRCECDCVRIYHFLDKDGDDGIGLFTMDGDGILDYQEFYPLIDDDELDNEPEDEPEDEEEKPEETEVREDSE